MPTPTTRRKRLLLTVTLATVSVLAHQVRYCGRKMGLRYKLVIGKGLMGSALHPEDTGQNQSVLIQRPLQLKLF